MNFSRKPYPVQIHPDPLYVDKHVKALSNAAGMAETIATHDPTSQSRSKLNSFAQDSLLVTCHARVVSTKSKNSKIMSPTHCKVSPAVPQ